MWERENVCVCVCVCVCVQPKEAKKAMEAVLGQLSAINNLPKSPQGLELSKQIPQHVHKLTQHMSMLEEIKALKKSASLTTETQIKIFLADIGSVLQEAVDVVKMAKALQK